MVLPAAAIAMAAALLFVVEPLVGRVVLPMLGGAPMVWTTCVLFFQTVLLASYLSAHGLHRWLGTRRAALVYAAALIVPLASLPIAIRAAPPDASTTPVIWIFTALSLAVGLPFFVLAMSSTLLQRLASAAAGGRDPYVLYAASNAGSLAGLLAYPFIIEPWLGLADQRRAWAWGYVAFVALAIATIVTAWREAGTAGDMRLADKPDAEVLTAGRRVRWVALAAVPSSAMLGVTSYLSNNIASIALLWVVPLALYLATFIAAFAQPGRWSRFADQRLPLGAAAVCLAVLLEVNGPIWLVVPVHLLTFTLVALLCHATLADDRPSVRHLTEFYVWIAVGGAVGAVVNTLIAPLLFATVLEYPLAIVAACALRTAGRSSTDSRAWLADGALALGVAAAASVLPVAFGTAGIRPEWILGGLAVGAFSQAARPRRFALVLAALVVTGATAPSADRHGQLLLTRRTFFGIHRVYLDSSGPYYALFHGTTLHGLEAVDPARAAEPLSYYHVAGPSGRAFAGLPRARNAATVAVVGLGIGSLARYAGPAARWTFFELDAEVARIARDTRYFHHLEACGARCEIVIGDARLTLAETPPTQFDLIVLDAFSSDAIPVHLLTSEAFALYLSRLTPGGALFVHVSNRHLTLAPVLARAALAHGLVARESADTSAAEIDSTGRAASDWVVLARTEAGLGDLADDSAWHTVTPVAHVPLWTDDRSSLLTVLRWNR